MLPNPTKFVLALLLLTLCATTHAQSNALENPGFDTDLSGWDVFEDRTFEWSEADADGSGDSGSALLGNEGTSGGSVPLVLHQCIQVLGEFEYHFGGDMFVPLDQPAGTTAVIFLQTFSNPDCSAGAVRTVDVSSSLVDEWASVENSITTGANIQSVRISLGVFKFPGVSDDAQAHFDNVYLLIPDPSLVDPSKSASWYNPDEGGHGIMIHLLNSTEAWMCWFTFDADGNPAWICALGTIDGHTITFDEAFTVEGGAFPPNFDPELVEEIPWGSIEVVFSGCDAGTMSWTTSAPGFESGEMPIVRLTPLWGSTCLEG